MMLEGVVQNGMIILKNGANLPEGTQVKVSVEQMPMKSVLEVESSFFRSLTMDELAATQSVPSPCSFDELLGGWPEEEKEDKFEDTVAAWRKEEMRRGGV